MKTLQYYMYGILFSVLSMGMGFPDIIMEKDLPKVAKHKEVKKVASKTSNISGKKEQYCTQAAKPVKKQQPKQKPASTASAATDSWREIYLKLFDKKGNLLLIENIRVDEFLSKKYSSQILPAGSKFVMFHGNTAYYYIESSI